MRCTVMGGAALPSPAPMNGCTVAQDLALEGGGVKGIALVGAVTELLDGGITVDRVAGTSAGAIVASLLAAGASPTQLASWVRDADYERFRDKGLLDRLGPLGKGASLLLERGLYEGDALRRFLTRRLEQLDVRTFADLRRADDDAPLSQRWSLVVPVVDLTVGRLLRLPWDARAAWDLDPDELDVATIVQASTAIPYFFEPVELRDGAGRTHVLVDGGLVANYPLELFRRADPEPAPSPTIGVKLSAAPEAAFPVRDLGGPRDYAETVVMTALAGQDRRLLTDPCAIDRTVFVDTSDVSAIDFDLSDELRDDLFARGTAAAASWRTQWDQADHLATCHRH